MTTTETWMDEAGQMVDGCPTKEDVVKLVANWIDTSAQFARNSDYYRDLLDRCGKAIGDRAYICDDGSKSDEVLRAKIPEIIESDYCDGG